MILWHILIALSVNWLHTMDIPPTALAFIMASAIIVINVRLKI